MTRIGNSREPVDASRSHQQGCQQEARRATRKFARFPEHQVCEILKKHRVNSDPHFVVYVAV